MAAPTVNHQPDRPDPTRPNPTRPNPTQPDPPTQPTNQPPTAKRRTPNANANANAQVAALATKGTTAGAEAKDRTIDEMRKESRYHYLRKWEEKQLQLLETGLADDEASGVMPCHAMSECVYAQPVPPFATAASQ